MQDFSVGLYVLHFLWTPHDSNDRYHLQEDDSLFNKISVNEDSYMCCLEVFDTIPSES